MQNTRYFNIASFNNYLQENVAGASLVTRTHGHSEDLVLAGIQDSSFQFVESDFLGSQSVTQGYYPLKGGGKGFWEEFRIRFKSPAHFKEKQVIPAGKYRIRVQTEDGKPVVRTFVRKSIGIAGWWKKESLPPSLPLDRILNGNLEDYALK